MAIPLQTRRRTAAEILAWAVKEIFPESKIVSGEVTEIGFQYDFIIEQPFDEMSVTLIEEKMRSICKSDNKIKILDMMRENAMSFFRHRDQDIKADIISTDPHNIVPIFQIGEFFDYAPGSHTSNSLEVGVVKILETEKLTTHLPKIGDLRVIRIIGTAFEDSMKMKQFLKRREGAKRRDHRILGKEMDLFSLNEDAGSAAWFWHPKGAIIRELLLDWWRKDHRLQGFNPLVTPRIITPGLLKKTRYMDFPDQANSVYPSFTLDNTEYVLSPSPSLMHASLFRSKLHSYRELPLRYAECTDVYSNRKASQLWGMLRARAFSADFAHIFCTPEQVLEELISSLQFIDKTVKILGFEYRWYLVPRGVKYAGTLSNWDKSLDWMDKALKTCGFDYMIDNQGKAFNGPRIDVRLIDALGREWSGPHVGIDFNLPEQLGLRYQGADDEMHLPVMITRSMFGSLERFVAILVEHYAGLFPLWLAPEQVRVVPVGAKQHDYADGLGRKLREAGLRVGFDYRHDNLGVRVHAAERERIPYMIIVGDREEKDGMITVRPCGQEGKTSRLPFETFLRQLQEEMTALPNKPNIGAGKQVES